MFSKCLERIIAMPTTKNNEQALRSPLVSIVSNYHKEDEQMIVGFLSKGNAALRAKISWSPLPPQP